MSSPSSHFLVFPSPSFCFRRRRRARGFTGLIDLFFVRKHFNGKNLLLIVRRVARAYIFFLSSFKIVSYTYTLYGIIIIIKFILKTLLKQKEEKIKFCNRSHFLNQILILSSFCFGKVFNINLLLL